MWYDFTPLKWQEWKITNPGNTVSESEIDGTISGAWPCNSQGILQCNTLRCRRASVTALNIWPHGGEPLLVLCIRTWGMLSKLIWFATSAYRVSFKQPQAWLLLLNCPVARFTVSEARKILSECHLSRSLLHC